MIKFIRKTIYVVALITITTSFIQTNIFAMTQCSSCKENTEKMQGCPICFPPKIKCPHCKDSNIEYLIKDFANHIKSYHAKKIENPNDTKNTDNKKGESYFCFICKKTISGNNFGMHVRQAIHAGQMYCCPFCEKTTSRTTSIAEHIYALHYFINDKDKQAINQSLLEHIIDNHVLAKKDGSLCTKCNKQFRTKNSLVTHNTNEHNKKKRKRDETDTNDSTKSFLPEENVTALQEITNPTYNTSKQEEDFFNNLMFFLGSKN